MSRRILFVAPYAVWTPHHETELELAEEHVRAGDDVTWLECLRELPYCEPNPKHELGRCLACAAKASHGRSLLSGAVKVVGVPPMAEAARVSLARLLDAIGDIDRLRELSIDGYDIGGGIVSSLVSVIEDPEPDWSDARVRELVSRMAEAGLRMFLGVRQLLDGGDFDLVYVFNGRFAASRGALRAALQAGVHCVVHERGSSPDKYMLRHNVMAHDLGQLRAEIEELWAVAGESEGWRNARQVFERMRAGEAIGWVPYVGQQRSDRLPESWNRAQRNIVFFVSSDDEYQELDAEWRIWTVFASQVDVIRAARQRLSGDARVKFWIRMHPNQERLPRRQLERYLALDAESGIEVIVPASPVSSYALMDAADCVVSFGSTTGIEAAYWGRPSVLLEQAAFRGLGSTYDAQSLDDAVAWISDPSLPPKDKLGAAKYGNHMLTFGKPFVHFESRGLFSGRFKGRKVRGGSLRKLRIALAWGRAAVTGGAPSADRKD